MSRLLNYLPPHMRDYRELKILFSSVELEFDPLQLNIKLLRDNGFIHTANDDGIARYEEMLALPKDTSLSLGERINRVLSRINEDTPYTYKSLLRKLDILLGTHNYTVDLYHNEYRIDIDIYPMHDTQIKEVKHTISYMLPANLIAYLSIVKKANRNTYVKGGVLRYISRTVKVNIEHHFNASKTISVGHGVSRHNILEVSLNPNAPNRRVNNDI